MVSAMNDPLHTLPGYSLRRAANAMMAELARRLATLELRQTEATILMLVDSNPGVTASALGRTLDIKRANMVPLLKRLDDAGLIERAPIDGKSQGLHLTKDGKARLAQVLAIIQQFEAELLERVPEEHRAHLLPALNSLWH